MWTLALAPCWARSLPFDLGQHVWAWQRSARMLRLHLKYFDAIELALRSKYAQRVLAIHGREITENLTLSALRHTPINGEI